MLDVISTVGNCSIQAGIIGGRITYGQAIRMFFRSIRRVCLCCLERFRLGVMGRAGSIRGLVGAQKEVAANRV